MKTLPRAQDSTLRDSRRRQISAVTSLSAAVLTALYGAPSRADTAASEENALQEVVVTASRRAVSAQDVPLSITAVTGESLAKAGIEDIAGLARSMAGVKRELTTPIADRSAASTAAP
jgi:iron complex outermembrane receptor protein